MVEWLTIRKYNENAEKCFVVFITCNGIINPQVLI